MMSARHRRAVFLDRDGTLTEARHYPAHPSDLVLQPHIGAPLRALQESGIALIVVTNQSGVARGLFDESAVSAMHDHLRLLLARHDIRLDGIYSCPHLPNAPLAQFRKVCACRKPAPGMLIQASQDLSLDLARSWMIGDSGCDIEAGRNAGTSTALVAYHMPIGVSPDIHGRTTGETLSRVSAALTAERDLGHRCRDRRVSGGVTPLLSSRACQPRAAASLWVPVILSPRISY